MDTITRNRGKTAIWISTLLALLVISFNAGMFAEVQERFDTPYDPLGDQDILGMEDTIQQLRLDLQKLEESKSTMAKDTLALAVRLEEGRKDLEELLKEKDRFENLIQNLLILR